jgi:hypothetical protein
MEVTFTAPTSEIPRDRWGRPLITPPDGGKAVGYTRISTLSKALDNKDALMAWKQRMTAIGLGKRPDLAQRAAITSLDDRKALNEIVEGAMAAAESDKAANIGTTLHALTEQVDAGTLGEVTPEHAADLAAYAAAMANIEAKAAELFVINDELQAAGTLDRIVALPDGRVVVADIKTGQSEPNYPHGVTTQVAIYARGQMYDPINGRGATLAEVGVDQHTGLLIWLPAGQARCELYTLDLAVGWSIAKTAHAVRTVFKSKPIALFTP